MPRLIDADAFEKVIEEKFQTHYGNSVYQFIHDFFRCIIRQINKAPTIDPESLRPQGQWHIFKDEEFLIAECPNCGMVVEATQAAWWDYCPNCGAKMKGARDDA